MKTNERGVMPHYKCEACKARLRVSGKSAEFVGDLCPECGSLLEPVTELTQLVGFRSITSRGGDAATEESERHQRIADLLGELVARRTSILERPRLDAERDDGDEPEAAAVVLPPPPISV
jgi:hypothetical protein